MPALNFPVLLNSYNPARTLRSGEYREKLAEFAQAFVDHKADLQFILTESSSIQISEMSANVGSVAAKLDAVSMKLDKAMALIGRQTPLEVSVAKQLQDNGGLQVHITQFSSVNRRNQPLNRIYNS